MISCFLILSFLSQFLFFYSPFLEAWFRLALIFSALTPNFPFFPGGHREEKSERKTRIKTEVRSVSGRRPGLPDPRDLVTSA